MENCSNCLLILYKVTTVFRPLSSCFYNVPALRSWNNDIVNLTLGRIFHISALLSLQIKQINSAHWICVGGTKCTLLCAERRKIHFMYIETCGYSSLWKNKDFKMFLLVRLHLVLIFSVSLMYHCYDHI